MKVNLTSAMPCFNICISVYFIIQFVIVSYSRLIFTKKKLRLQAKRQFET